MFMEICIINVIHVADEHLEESRRVDEACCLKVLNPDTRLTSRSPPSGPSTRPEQMEDHRSPYFCHLITHQVLETIARADNEGFDAMVIKCFDDLGVREARNFARTPVFGLSEATFHYACQLGGKLGALVPNMPGQIAFVQKQIDDMGLSGRMIPNGVRAERKLFVESFGEALRDPRQMVERLSKQAREMVDEGADVIVMACGGLGQICGVADFHVLEHRGARIPVVNPLATAVKVAEMTVAMRRGLGTPIPSEAHAGRRLSAVDFARHRQSFGLSN
jgi:Asp/Glu/hydantoin racemase